MTASSTGIDDSGEFIFVTLKFKFINELVSDSTITATDNHHQPATINHNASNHQKDNFEWWLVLETHCQLPSPK